MLNQRSISSNDIKSIIVEKPLRRFLVLVAHNNFIVFTQDKINKHFDPRFRSSSVLSRRITNNSCITYKDVVLGCPESSC